jgi:hypothetical protein
MQAQTGDGEALFVGGGLHDGRVRVLGRFNGISTVWKPHF